MSAVSLILKMMISAGKKVSESLNVITLDPKGEQEKLLRSILADGENSEFGKKYGFSSIKSVDDFRHTVPLTDYDFYSEYIEKMMRGEKNILSSLDTVHFNVTSGTMGVPKKIPVTEKHVSAFSRINAKYMNYVVSNELGTDWTRGKGLSLSEGTYKILPSGISIGCASSLHTARMERMIPFLRFDSMDMMYTSPKEACQPSALGTYSRYLHALFALREKNITYGNVTFSSILLELMRFIETRWEMLCDDIERGTINESVDMPASDRKSAENKLKPMPERAAELREIFKNHIGEQFGKYIWPGLRFFMMVGGAGFQTYTDKLLSRYLGPEVHILYFGLSSSEGMYSAPVKPDDTNAVFIPDTTFLEFIPVKNGERDLSHGTLLLHELEIGGQYELVITNLSGLYRYQLKDVIEVTGMYNNTPTMQFVNRSGFAINICAEKTSEKALRFTAEKTAEELGLDMYDYCVCPVQDDNGARYIFMYELNDYTPGVTKKDIRDITEKYLIEANPDYGEELATGNCQPTEILLLQRETFMLYRDLMVMKGKSAAQLKPVHVANTPFQQKFFRGLEDCETKFPD